MATSKKKTGPRPSGPVAKILQSGLAARELAELHRARIEERLEPGTIDRLGEDLTSLRGVVPAALFARGARAAATGSQSSAAERARRLVMKMRKSISTSTLPKAAQREFGVGTDVKVGVMKTVLAAGERMLSRAASHPDEARAAGILARDLAALRAAIDGAAEADAAQESRKLVQKNATAARDELLARIELHVKRISAAGALEFDDDDPETARKFEALTAPKRAKATAPAPV